MRTICLFALSVVCAAAQSSGWTYSYVYSFSGGAAGSGPYGLAVAPNGTIYGYLTVNACCNGGVFQLSPPAAPGGPWTETVLYAFQGGDDGSQPVGSIVIGPSGELFGATRLGGNTACGAPGCGTVFQLTPPETPGGTWTETVLYRFQDVPDACLPSVGPALGPDGSLYGTTYDCGSHAQGSGAVYQVTPPTAPGGSWTESVIHSFSQFGPAGCNPTAGIAVSAASVLYGSASACSIGSIFSLAPPSVPGGAWQMSLLRKFGTGGTLALSPGGDLYGFTENAGTARAFQLTPPALPNANWTEVVLHSFGEGPGGWDIVAGPALDASGNVYGTTTKGGTAHSGVIFQITPPTSPGGTWTENLLYNFATNDGGGAVIVSPDGGLYGTSIYGESNQGAIYELSPPSRP